MEMQKIRELAQMLIEAHGSRAEQAAARRQAEEERKGNAEEVQTWKRVRSVLVETRGPHES